MQRLALEQLHHEIRAAVVGVADVEHLHALLGTPQYMSPEQCRGAGEVDARADVYSMGCVLFECLSGRAPFTGQTPTEQIVSHMTEDPPRLSSVIDGVPRSIDQLVARCLTKQPLERPADGAELAAALGDVHNHLVGQVALETDDMTAVTPPPFVVTATSVRVVQRPSAPRRRWVVPVVAVATIAAGVAAVLVSTAEPSKSSTVTMQMTPGATADAAVNSEAIGNDAATAPIADGPAAAVDAHARTRQELRAVITAFVTWSKSHARAPCPDVAIVLGRAAVDGWGTPITLTCTEQPTGQVAGARSDGPDRTAHTADDVASWQLDDLPQLVRGERWNRKATTERPPPRRLEPRGTSPNAGSNSRIIDSNRDGILDKR